MSPRGRFVLRWLVLTVTAIVLGSGLGTVYALHFKPAAASWDVPEAGAEDVWPPSAPQLVTPEHRAVVRTSTPTFEWTTPEDVGNGVFGYVLQFAYDPDFGKATFREYMNIDEPRFEVPSNEPFAPGLPVYWRVYAIDTGLNQSPYSPVFSFTPLAVPAK